MSLWRYTLGIAREHGRLSDIVQSQVEHHDALHADTTASMRGTAEAECFDVRRDFRGVYGE